MAQDIFLDLEGIEGESTDAKHTDWIELLSYNFGIKQTGAVGDGGPGKVSFTHVSVTKYSDASSPKLMLFCAQGTRIKKGVIEACQAAKDKHVCMRITLGDVVVSQIHLGHETEGEAPTETVELNFSTIEFEYIPINEAGKPQAARKMNWILRSHRA